MDISLPALRVTQVLDRLAVDRGLPELFTVDNGPELAEARRMASFLVSPHAKRQTLHLHQSRGRRPAPAVMPTFESSMTRKLAQSVRPPSLVTNGSGAFPWPGLSFERLTGAVTKYALRGAQV